MLAFLKNDLTYSLGGGFAIGAAALLFVQPVEQRAELVQSVAQQTTATLQSASQMFS